MSWIGQAVELTVTVGFGRSEITSGVIVSQPVRLKSSGPFHVLVATAAGNVWALVDQFSESTVATMETAPVACGGCVKLRADIALAFKDVAVRGGHSDGRFSRDLDDVFRDIANAIRQGES